MKLVIVNFDLLFNTCKRLKLNYKILYDGIKKENNDLLLVIKKEIPDFLNEDKKPFIKYDYLFSTKDSSLVDESNKFISYAYSVNDAKNVLMETYPHNYDSYIEINKEKINTKNKHN